MAEVDVLLNAVRALSFMFPQATETLQYIGMVGLGLDPQLDL